ncbi:MAG: TetR/AcrR family transcriptional regulator [Gammaproteobacteria bacterium]
MASNRAVNYDRTATEDLLQKAALRMLDRDGVLAGLNLREVAEEAGVNRGLVYHYFGSRAALLRRALRRTARKRIGAISSARDLPFGERVLHYWRSVFRFPREIRLVTLLLLDSSSRTFDARERPQLTPLREETVRSFREDQANGEVVEDLDVDGLHAVIVALACGYSLYRKDLARSARVSVTSLDGKVESVLRRMLAGLETK